MSVCFIYFRKNERHRTVRALFVQLKKRKRISADFILLDLPGNEKLNSRGIFFFPRQKEKQNSETRVPLWPFFLNKTKNIQTYAFLFTFSERTKKGNLNHAFLFDLSEESINGIQNDWFLFSFSWCLR